MYFRSGFLVAACLFVGQSIAQTFGGNPASVKWKQINTDTVRIIFPSGLDSVAQRVAAITHYLQKHQPASIGSHTRKIDIVLQNEITYSNGYVGLGPYRSEFYLAPPQNPLELGAQAWADNLAIHEFRHIQQYGNFRHGISKLMSVLFGQDGQAVANGAAVPDWFFEGDAVYQETMVSKQGRGRLPAFFNGYKSLLFGNRQYSYMKLRNGSLRQYVPDHYRLGYLLVAYGRDKYGDDFWHRVTQDAVRFKPLFYPFQGAVRRHAGISYEQFVKDAMSYYQERWKLQPSDSIRWLTGVRKKEVVNYQYPYVTDDGGVIALRNSSRSIPAFYERKEDGTERKIAVRDIANDNYFSYHNNKLVYAAWQPHVRWGYQEYSVIRVLDVATGRSKVVTRKTRYFAPDMAHDGRYIVAAEFSAGQESSIVLMDSSGNTLRNLKNRAGYVYSYPKFSADDRFVYWLNRNPAGEMSIERQPVEGGEVETVLGFANRLLSYPVVQGDTLLYTSSNNGNDEIWAYVGRSGNHFRLSVYKTGLYQGAVDKSGAVVSAAFTADGYRLGALKSAWQAVKASGDSLENLYVKHPFQPVWNQTLEQVQQGGYAVRKYPKAKGLFNFHSWQPDYDDPEFSFTVYGQNVLNTLQSELSYVYNENEGFSRVGYTGTYGGWFVQPFVSLNQTWQRRIRYNRDTVFNWNETVGTVGLRLPLLLSGGKQYRSLVFTSSYNAVDANWTGMAKRLLKPISFVHYMEARVQYSGQIQAAAQHIYPHWGHSLLLQYRQALNQGVNSRQFLASGNFYLPGLAASHSIVLSASWQARDTSGGYSFSSNFPFSRGYQAVDYPRMWRLGANYHLPLWLPDWGLAQVVYFRRIRANLFYDVTGGKSLRTGVTTRFGTAGMEMYFDTRWWNQEGVTFGFRYNRLLNSPYFGGQGRNIWEIIWPVNLFNR
ncbi:TolB family protein [Filimonas effusa]|uniref:Uncharacterized protein n=1 Tax=Filimonas effusa TaxID=2508721 RepID=A0A4Q1DDB4_9BACT|nr:hypothetical protein [Filimonas effusa]RXK86653.1 hypothetical protein ESB13_07565 [Filimonas effusa]